MKSFYRGRLAVALLALCMTPVSGAVTVEGVEFPEAVSVGGQALNLVGTGVATYKVLFDVYASAIYTPVNISRRQILADDTARQLQTVYLRELEAKTIVEAANRILERQLSATQREALAERLKRFHGWYRSVAAGDRYTLSYAPDEGTQLSLNGEPLGSVEGADFARAYFGIWLGDCPLSKDLRQSLTERLPAGS